jgi:NAD(P)-dependent dehydrogenase (short-subunit alcohol dehydrogenase family)
MGVVVVTGSTRGIGYGLAAEFLQRDCQVVVSGRTAEAVDEAVAELEREHGAGRVLGQPCDVTLFEQVQGLWDAAVDRFGRVDFWINNAGISQPQMSLWEQPPERIAAVISTNLIGTMFGCKVAIRGMLDQGFGAVYNMEGLGSDGRWVEGLTLYATTKYGMRYLDESLAKEVEGTGLIVGAIAPGMVVTDLITDQYEKRPEDWESAKAIFNVLADRVETVTPWLAEQILANEKNGQRIAWLTRTKIMGRFLTARLRPRDLFAEQ